MLVNPYEEVYGGSFVGGGAAELIPDHLNAWSNAIEQIQYDEELSKLKEQNETASNLQQNETLTSSEQNETSSNSSLNTKDIAISFGDHSEGMGFSRRIRD